jgi:hypothetical protein
MEINRELVELAISNALNFIESEQLDNGGFESLSSADHRNFSDPKVYHTVFFPAVISCALGTIKDYPKAAVILDRSIQFLDSEKSRRWSFNYWSKTSVQFNTQPYPDDFDDTACALAAISMHNSESISGEGWARIIEDLIAAEVRPGGLGREDHTELGWSPKMRQKFGRMLISQ